MLKEILSFDSMAQQFFNGYCILLLHRLTQDIADVYKFRIVVLKLWSSSPTKVRAIFIMTLRLFFFFCLFLFFKRLHDMLGCHLYDGCWDVCLCFNI